jgi:hypothetical protein
MIGKTKKHSKTAMMGAAISHPVKVLFLNTQFLDFLKRKAGATSARPPVT